MDCGRHHHEPQPISALSNHSRVAGRRDLTMYKHILVTLDNSPADEAILPHIRGLASLLGARITLLHVADGFMARNQNRFDESSEMREDRDYLERRRKGPEN